MRVDRGRGRFIAVRPAWHAGGNGPTGYVAVVGGRLDRRPVWPIMVGIGAALLAAAIGYLTAVDPWFAAAILGGTGVMLVAFLATARICLMLLAASAVSVQYAFPDVTLFGMELQALQKLAMLALLTPALLRYGVAWYRLLPMAAFAVMFAMTWIWGNPMENLSAGDSFKALLGLTAPLLLMAVRWPEREAGLLVHMVLFLPLVSLFFGVFLQMAGIQPVIVHEFTGAVRLQGANIPAHLAFLAYMALTASILLWKKQQRRSVFLFGMMAVNFLILLLTGTRGPLLASVPLVLVFLFDLWRLFAKGRSGLVVPLAGITGLIAASVLWQWDNLVKRSFTRFSSAGIDMSGREEAWRYFIERAAESPWLGQGLGSVLLANDGTLYAGFVVPHNEYIRFYHDGGIVGAVLLFASLLAVLLGASGRMKGGMKAYWFAMVVGFLLYSISDNTLSTLQFMVPFCAVVGAFGSAGDGRTRAGEVSAGQEEMPQTRAAATYEYAGSRRHRFRPAGETGAVHE